jgi:prepilin-type N-terminal cleavage/methylation domain-containing protein/prepilin-type processing-associated H-X9-DG protein
LLVEPAHDASLVAASGVATSDRALSHSTILDMSVGQRPYVRHFEVAVRLLLSAVFAVAALAKAYRLDSLDPAFSTIGWLGEEHYRTATVLLLSVELAIAYLLLIDVHRARALALSFVVIVLFTVFIGWLLTRHNAPSCGCFGELALVLSARDSNQLALARNIVLLLLHIVAFALVGWRQLKHDLNPSLYLRALTMRPSSTRARPTGFTLLELLVVIGIIGVLLAILLPTLSLVRQSGQRLGCVAQQREILNAGLGAAAETGYLPLAGDVYLPAGVNGYGSLPAAVRDVDRSRYVYAREATATDPPFTPAEEQVVPPPFALASRLGGLEPPSGYVEWAEAVARDPTLHLFECPSESFRSEIRGELPMKWEFTPEGGHLGMWKTGTDYAFNAGVTGFHHDLAFSSSRAAGQLTRVVDASRTVLLADASLHEWAGDVLTGFVPALSTVPVAVSLSDGMRGAGTLASFSPLDEDRHAGRVNVAFCDGSVRSFQADPAALEQAWLISGD